MTHRKTVLGCFIAGTALFSFNPAANAAMSSADCEARFMTMDANKDGMLTQTEAGQDFARYRVGGKTLTDNQVARDQYITDCTGGMFDETSMDKGAPLEGANSFTEEQARDRAMANGLTDISPLKLDDKGIWRGTATHNKDSMNVAIDYKGNVVTTKK